MTVEHRMDIARETAAQEVFRATFEQAAVGIAHTSIQRHYTSVNAKFCDMLGYTRAELLTMRSDDVTHRDDLADDRLQAERMLAGRIASFSGEKRLIKKNGDTLWVNRSVSIAHGPDGQPSHFIRFIEDLSERKRIEGALVESERFSKSTIDALPQQLCVLDEDGTIITTNQAWRESPTSQRAHPLCHGAGDNYLKRCDATHGDDAPAARAFSAGIRSVLSGERRTFALEYPLRSATGTTWFEGSVTRFPGAGAIRVVVMHSDVTERRIQNNKIARASRIYAVLSGINSLVLRERDRDELFREACRIVVDEGGYVMTWIGLLREADRTVQVVATAGAIGNFFETASTILQIDANDSLPVARVINGNQPVYSNDVGSDPQILVKPQLAERGIHSLALLPLAVDGRAIGVLALYASERNAFDADEMRLLIQLAGDLSFALGYMDKEQKLNYLAYFDALTGLPNRVLFRDRLKQALVLAERNQWTSAIFFIDLDGFKLINDSFGHAGGDQLLQQAADRLRGCVRGGDTIARFGGDEFAIILPNIKSAQAAAFVGQKILDAFAPSFEIDGLECFVTSSIGIALYPDDSDNSTSLIRHADAAMYSAKAAGRNNFSFYTEAMNTDGLERTKLESSLRRALERNEFILHYQPKVDIITGKIIGVEALLRWDSPERGLVAPLDFIPTLEETGLIVPVGGWVARAACAQLAEWLAAGVLNPAIAINLSSRQLQQDGLDRQIAYILEEFSLPKGCLEIEITESMLMQDPDAAILVLRRLRELGIRISVDDFGTGYSSLSYLRRLPLDALKVDRSFVREVAVNPDDAAIARAIVTMAHSMNLKVIAEGVETEEQLGFLRANRCDEAQGFLFAKPVSAAAVTTMLMNDASLYTLRDDRLSDMPTVLIVDDDKACRTLLEALFTSDDYRVLSASSPMKAFDALALHSVDVIVSDQNMPGMQGVEFLARVRRMHPRIVRIMMTGQDDAQTVTSAINQGEVSKFFVKQRDEGALVAEVHRRLKFAALGKPSR